MSTFLKDSVETGSVSLRDRVNKKSSTYCATTTLMTRPTFLPYDLGPSMNFPVTSGIVSYRRQPMSICQFGHDFLRQTMTDGPE